MIEIEWWCRVHRRRFVEDANRRSGELEPERRFVSSRSLPFSTMAPPATVDTRGKTPVPHNKRHLGLVSAAKPQRLTPALLVHFLFVFLPHVCESDLVVSWC